MTFLAITFAALSIIEPNFASDVPTLRDGQKAYFEGNRVERTLRMNNDSDRAKLFAVGSTQKPLRLQWSGDTNAVYSLSVDFAEGGAKQEFTITNLTTVYLTNLELGKRYVWSVTDEHGDTAASMFTTEPMAPRLLRAEGLGNFRDLGGWKTKDGKVVRENMIFRSAGLRFSSKQTGGIFKKKVELGAVRIKDAGIRTLQNDFKIKTDLELRTPQETAGMNGTLLGKDVRWVNESFAAYDFIDNVVRGREPFAKIFKIFADKTNYPVLMHCSGGRDRTGTLAFLLNGLLGVDEDDLCRDWEASIFSDQSKGFSHDRIDRLIAYLNGLPGDTLMAKIESYARSCGVSAQEISNFRAIMLK